MSTTYRTQFRVDVNGICIVGGQVCNNVHDLMLCTRSMRHKGLRIVHVDKLCPDGWSARLLKDQNAINHQ
jgi:hypothetical protein